MDEDDLISRFWKRRAKKTLEGEELEGWAKILSTGGRLLVSSLVWDAIHMHPRIGPLIHARRILMSPALVRGQCIAVAPEVPLNYALSQALRYWNLTELDAMEGPHFHSKYT